RRKRASGGHAVGAGKVGRRGWTRNCDERRNLAASWGRLGSNLASNSKALVRRNVSGRTGVHNQRRGDAALRPGEHLFLDDTTGKGHSSRVIGGADWFGVGVDLVGTKPGRDDDRPLLLDSQRR